MILISLIILLHNKGKIIVGDVSDSCGPAPLSNHILAGSPISSPCMFSSEYKLLCFVHFCKFSA